CRSLLGRRVARRVRDRARRGAHARRREPGRGGRDAMKRRRAVPTPDAITRVNVTLIINVALVLFTILLVTAPLMSVAALPVNLPAARTREAERERNVS